MIFRRNKFLNKDINWLIKLRTYLCLGITNILRVVFYRLSLKSRLHPVQYIKAPISSAPFFRASERQGKTPQEIKDWDNSIHLFGWYIKQNVNEPPDWFHNLVSNNQTANAQKNWWDIPDFGNDDIKCVWELSRFNWVVAFSTKIANGNKLSILKLNLWLENWAQTNPPYKGPNWKCAQECSIRVINLITAAWILGQDLNPENGLIDIIKTHLKRIDKTLSYAIAQQNNHAISEAAALFIGGSFLLNLDKRAEAWTFKGRRLLEDHISNLIESDGTFSQYSLNYHRFMLDTCSLVEAWRSHKGLEFFSENFINKLKVATEWLWTFTGDENGNTPNIGANDGSQILQLSRGDYCDYRPSVQLAATLFMNVDAFGDGSWNEVLLWLKVTKGNRKKKIGSITFDKGGYHVLRNGKSMAVLNYPQFRFRPTQSDALHVDLWVNGKNLLKDGGTFSYNSNITDWFMSTAAHNTIEFDKQNQMPHISRFLFGDWLKSSQIKSVKKDNNYLSASASYKDKYNNYHQRKIILNKNEFICHDKISGNFKEACLRWRLISEDWQLNEKTFSNKNYSISIEINDLLTIPTMETTLESRYYQQQNKVPMLYVKVNKPSTLITKFTF